MKRKNHPLRTGVIAAVAAFIALSVFAGGFIEISRDAGLARWFTDTAVYLVVNKFGSKLFASLVIGCGAAFANSMIAYGRAVKSQKRTRATRVRFTPRRLGHGAYRLNRFSFFSPNS